MSPTFLDHITVTAPTLEAGAEFVYQSLGFKPQTGGEHPRMGTHNLFLRLGDALFLEVIAINPDAQNPKRPRWFTLDNIKPDTPATLKTWVIRTEDIYSSVENSAESLGDIEPMSRGDNNWLFTIPKDGSLPLDEAAPALIQWQFEKHPALGLNDYGLSLHKLQVYLPDANRLEELLHTLNLMEKVEIVESEQTKIVATINTPQGLKILGA